MKGFSGVAWLLLQQGCRVSRENVLIWARLFLLFVGPRSRLRKNSPVLAGWCKLKEMDSKTALRKYFIYSCMTAFELGHDRYGKTLEVIFISFTANKAYTKSTMSESAAGVGPTGCTWIACLSDKLNELALWLIWTINKTKKCIERSCGEAQLIVRKLVVCRL